VVCHCSVLKEGIMKAEIKDHEEKTKQHCYPLMIALVTLAPDSHSW
jgi:hypothetical protein